MVQLIDGKAVANSIRNELKNTVEKLRLSVGLAVIIAGDDPASAVYVKNKISACAEVGISSYHYSYPSDVKAEELLERIDELNEDVAINGILVQLPLPKHLDERAILARIRPDKDVDGFSAYQMGRLVLGESCFPSCTPFGVMALLKHYNISLAGKKAVVIGRSNTVGKPMALMLLQENATVTICHSRTQNLSEVTRDADILVSAIGKPKFVTAEMVKDGAVVIDIGINRTAEGLCGDVDFASVKEKCSYITPVPGGVGPMTVTMLLKNTVESVLRGNER